MKRKIAMIFLVVFVLGVVTTCYAANRWVYFGRTEKGNWYYDSETLRPYEKESGSYVDIWVKEIYFLPQTNNASYMIQHFYINRSNSYYMIKEVYKYDENNVIVERKSEESNGWKRAVPNSIVEGLIKRLNEIM